MRSRILISLALVSLALPAAALEVPVSAKQTALDFVSALQRNDLAAARAHVLTYSQWQSLSKRALDEKAHVKKHESMLRALVAEFSRGTELAKLDLKDVLLLPAGKKTKQQVIMAVLHASLRQPEKKDGPGINLTLTFVQVGGAWKYMVKS